MHSDKVRFVANQQGGFRVFCGDANVTASFVRAMTEWRENGAERSLSCPCGRLCAFEDLDFRPHAGFYRFALEFRDVGGAKIGQLAERQFTNLLGPHHIVYRRVG